MKRKLKDFFLSKEIIASLDDQIMKQVKGGVTGYLSCTDMLSTVAAGCTSTVAAGCPPEFSSQAAGCPPVSTMCPSDIRFKKNITDIQNPLEKITALAGVSYDWKSDEFPEKGFSNSRQIGFIAQDLEMIVPEIIGTDEMGYKAINYGLLSPLLVESIKLLTERLKQCDERISNLENSLANITEQKVEDLEARLLLNSTY